MDETKRKSLAFFVCFFLFLIWLQIVWTPFRQNLEPKPEKKQEAATDSTDAAKESAETIAAVDPSLPKTGFPSEEELAAAGQLRVETDRLITTISLLGGRTKEIRLKDYKETVKKKSPLLNLVHHKLPQGAESLPYPFGVNVGEETDSWVQYSLKTQDPAQTSNEILLSGAENKVVTLEGRLFDGSVITKNFHFFGDKYFVDISVESAKAAAEALPVAIEWNQVEPALPEQRNTRLDSRSFVWFNGETASRELMHSFDSQRATLPPNGRKDLEPVTWISEGDRYFGITFIAIDSLDGSKTTSRPASIFGTENLHGIALQGKPDGTLLTRAYLGPKSYSTLEALGYRMELNVDFGILSFISVPLLLLLQFLYNQLGNYGLAIIALTILVKTALFRLTAAQLKSMKAMQSLKPEMDRIKNTIEDKQKQNTELMALYKKKGVNPMGGCLPILVQMPIFIGLFYTLQEALELRHSPFIFWIKDLSAPEELMIFGIGIPLMVILFVISMVVQQWLQPTPGMDPLQRKMMMIMPIVLGFMFVSFPAGLTLYWLTNNLISIGQTKALQLDAKRSTILVTTAVSVGVFLLGWILVLLSNSLRY